MVITVFLVLVAAAVGSLSQRHLISVATQSWQKQARYAAYSGVQDGLEHLATDRHWSAPLREVPLSDEGGVEYSVQFDNNLSGSEGRYAPDNVTWIPAGSAYMFSLGVIPNRASEGVAAFAAVVGPQQMKFNHAIFGTERVIVDGSKVRDWDPERVSEGGDLQAHVGTNSNTVLAAHPSSPLVASNGAHIEGELRIGVGGSLDLIADAGASHQGKKISDEAKVLTDIPPFVDVFTMTGTLTLPATPNRTGYIGYLLHPGVYEDVIVPAGATLLLAPVAAERPEGSGQIRALNTYSFQNLTLEPGASIAVQGAPGPGRIPPNDSYPIKVYVRESMMLQGNNTANWNSDTDTPFKAEALQVYFAGNDTRLRASGAPSKLSLTVAGSDLLAELDNVQFYGAVLGKDVRLTNSSLYYDLRLRSVPLEGVGELAIQSLVELPTSMAQISAEAGGMPPAMATKEPERDLPEAPLADWPGPADPPVAQPPTDPPVPPTDPPVAPTDPPVTPTDPPAEPPTDPPVAPDAPHTGNCVDCHA